MSFQPLPLAEPPQPGPAKRFIGRHRLALTAVAFTMGVLLAAAAVLVAARLNHSTDIALAVNDCVAIESERPVEYACTDERAGYRIAARQDIVWPVASACMKFQDTTQAVPEPAAAGEQPDTALCLAPTRFNTTDPGALQAGDCIDVQGAGDSITRVSCRQSPHGSRVVATELHRQIPVTDQACRAHPSARQAFAHPSLGGRTLVVCAAPTDPKDIRSAVVGDCTDRNLSRLISCDSPEATLRALTVRMVYVRPESPKCRDVFGATASSMTDTDKTDLVFTACFGPADQNAALYSVVGDCLSVSGTGPASRSHRIDCTDPAATHDVIERHESPDKYCPSGTESVITWDAGVTTGVTVCLARR
ncbi:LppU/SCO3897 family protein [Nocardia sp. R7R-8]|uniref:LppU/SCO3897 family protein n=1 Tax=Nocardia sp. R7R-8 TaxID=3459304 RepID=UPI00403DB25E